MERRWPTSWAADMDFSYTSPANIGKNIPDAPIPGFNGEKDRLVRQVQAVWGKGKPENPHGATPYEVKQMVRDSHSTVGQTADAVAQYFGLFRA